MKTRKLLIALFLMLSMLFTFTSCNPDDDDDGDSGEKTYTVYTANTTISNYNSKLGGSDYNLEEGYYIIFYKGDNYQSDAETIKSMFYWSQSTQTESQLRTNFNDWGIKSEHITSFLDGTVYGFAIAQSSTSAYLIFVFPSSTGANSSGSSGNNSGSSGTSGSSGSGTSSTAYYPTFTAGTVLATEEYYEEHHSSSNGDYTISIKDYYYFSTPSTVIRYRYKDGVYYNKTNLSYSSATGALKKENSSSIYRYLWRINGTYYLLDSDSSMYSSGTGLYSTFSVSGSTETYSSNVSLTISSNGTWTYTAKDNYTDGSWDSGSGSGTYTNSNGILYLTGSVSFIEYDAENNKNGTWESLVSWMMFYNGSSLRGISHSLTSSSLPSTSRSFSDTPKAEAHFQQSKLKLK